MMADTLKACAFYSDNVDHCAYYRTMFEITLEEPPSTPPSYLSWMQPGLPAYNPDLPLLQRHPVLCLQNNFRAGMGPAPPPFDMAAGDVIAVRPNASQATSSKEFWLARVHSV